MTPQENGKPIPVQLLEKMDKPSWQCPDCGELNYVPITICDDCQTEVSYDYKTNTPIESYSIEEHPPAPNKFNIIHVKGGVCTQHPDDCLLIDHDTYATEAHCPLCGEDQLIESSLLCDSCGLDWSKDLTDDQILEAYYADLQTPTAKDLMGEHPNYGVDYGQEPDKSVFIKASESSDGLIIEEFTPENSVIEVDLIASGYEWTCPICEGLCKEIEITEEVQCCETIFKTGAANHAY